MSCCFKHINRPFNSSYLLLKCMSLRLQAFPKIIHRNVKLLPVSTMLAEPKYLQIACREEDFTRYEIIPFNIHGPEITEIDNLGSRSATSFSILDESVVPISHNCVWFESRPTSGANDTISRSPTDLEVRGCSKLPHPAEFACKDVQSSSGNKSPDSTGRATEEQLAKIHLALADNVPSFFHRAHNYELYNQNIVFHNNISGVVTRGMFAYSRHLSMIRIKGQLKYTQLKMHVLKITHHPEDGTVRVRWRVSGVFGMKVFFMFWKFRPSTIGQLKEAEWIDGFSIFHVGPDGLIYKHVCDKMMPDENVEKVKVGPLGVKFAAVLGLLSHSNIAL